MKKIILPIILLSIVMIVVQTISNADRRYGTVSGDETYCFAVDVEDFVGDVYKSGNYHFEMEPELDQIPSFYEVYVTNEYFEDISLLTDEHFVNYVGGLQYKDDNLNIELTAGTYVYIIPVEILYPHSGKLIIELNQ